MNTRSRLALLVCLATAVSMMVAGPAAANSPWWHLTSSSRPTVLSSEAGARGEVVLTAANLGDATDSGETTPISIEDKLPEHLKLRSVEAISGQNSVAGNRGPVICTKAPLVCTFKGTLPPYDQIEVRVKVETLEGAGSGEENEVSVSGGDSLPAHLSRPLVFSESEQELPFGVSEYELQNEEAGGAPATQAGSHPFQQTTTIALNEGAGANSTGVYSVNPAGALAKDVHFRWPAGLLGNPSPLARCTLVQFLTLVHVEENSVDTSELTNACPARTAVGAAMVTVEEPVFLQFSTITVPIFNLEPAFGKPARLGFFIPVAQIPVVIEPAIRSGNGEDYGLTITVPNITQTSALLSTQAIVWGVPGDPRHDNSRGWGCMAEAAGLPHTPCLPTEEPHPPAFFTLPTSCPGTPMATFAQADSWAEPLNPGPLFPADPPLPALDGCNRLPFSPTIHSEPTSDAATTGTGLSFDLDFNDEGLLNHEGLAQSEMKRAVVTLPQGFTTNPSVAEGLHACTQAEYEAATIQEGSGCSGESKIGDVTVESPLIVGKKVTGGLFVATQGQNPNHNLLTIYLIARNAELGVLVRQALKVTPDPATGRLTTEVDNVPQLPFSHFELSFRQGQRSPLITPPTCGTYTVQADLYPYSEPDAPVHRESSFQITGGPEGLPCPSGGLPPFHPVLEAGSQNNAAGSFSPFTTKITRKDSEQEITHFSIKLPPGVSGKLAGIPECSDAAIAAAKAREHEGGGTEELNSPSCPQASEIGHSLVGSGVGNVLAYAPGKLYLAGPYHGSNLSFASITAAKVGPFDLGTVVVRFALRIDPETGEVSVDGRTSDPIPHIVDGIPVHLRDLRAYVDRPEFTLNPTNCTRTSTASTVLGSGLDFASEADDRPITISSPFQAADCAALPFEPKLSLKLKGGTKRGQYPSLKATLRMHGIGEAGVKRAQVTLPRSEFIANAHFNTICTRVQFKEGGGNGEKCPAGSVYGHAKAITPILAEPLEGPIFLRSSEHQLPDVVVALHNKQVDIDLDGHVDSVKGQLRNTFEAAPDAPVSSVTLEFEGGKKGLFENSTNLCKGTHKAIAAFTGQNGKEHDFNPVMQVKCPKARKAKAKHKRRAG